jgi:hypothetical protein
MITNQCCPAATSLPTIPAESCAKRFGQTQKIIFQRLYDGSTRNGIADGTSSGQAGLLASWTALKTATDSTKIAVTPFVENPTPDGGDAKTVGGGNESLNGAERVIGSNPVGMSFKLNNKAQSIIAELKKLMCEALANNLGVYLINENGQIMGRKESNGGTDTWYPMPIQTLFVSDLMPNGLDADDSNDLSFKFVPGYSDKVDFITLDASALAL